MRSRQPLLLRSHQATSIIRQPKTMLMSRWTSTNQKNPQTTHQSSSHPQDMPKLATKSADRPGLLMWHINAKTWPKPASSPSSTSTHLPAFEPLHLPWQNPMDIPMQCHSTWQCNNQTGTSLLMPWHGS